MTCCKPKTKTVSLKLVLKIFEFVILPIDCFIYRQNVTCLKRLTRYGHYTSEVEVIIIAIWQLTLKSLC